MFAALFPEHRPRHVLSPWLFEVNDPPPHPFAVWCHQLARQKQVARRSTRRLDRSIFYHQLTWFDLANWQKCFRRVEHTDQISSEVLVFPLSKRFAKHSWPLIIMWYPQPRELSKIGGRGVAEALGMSDVLDWRIIQNIFKHADKTKL